jgi:hypothetical protein
MNRDSAVATVSVIQSLDHWQNTRRALVKPGQAGPNNAVILFWASLAPPPPRTLHHFGPGTVVLHSFTPSPLNQISQTIRGLHVVYCPSNILNILHFQRPIDHRCLGRLYKDNWNRPIQESLRCRNRTGRFSRGYPRTAPRARGGIQGLSARKSETNQLSQPGGECYPGALGHFRRGGQPGKSHIPSGNSFKRELFRSPSHQQKHCSLGSMSSSLFVPLIRY